MRIANAKPRLLDAESTPCLEQLSAMAVSAPARPVCGASRTCAALYGIAQTHAFLTVLDSTIDQLDYMGCIGELYHWREGSVSLDLTAEH